MSSRQTATRPHPSATPAQQPAKTKRGLIDLRDSENGRGRPVEPSTRPNIGTGSSSRSTWRYSGRRAAPYPSTRIAVRALDLTIAVAGFAMLWPLMLGIALAVKVDSKGSVLFASPRLGQKQGTFTAWKFRSMRQDAEARLQHVLASDPAARREYETYHKLKNDPRLTRVGRLIRRTSLDELPQLFNILRGEMSVVGPRPNLISEADLFGPALPLVLQIRPGLTGLWQVSGRNRLPVEERVLLDIEYVRTRTLAGDLTIVAKTFLQLWQPGKHGAY